VEGALAHVRGAKEHAYHFICGLALKAANWAAL
jgi:hypothetical protein